MTTRAPTNGRNQTQRSQPAIDPAEAMNDSFIIGPDDRILVTGAAGFIGTRVVESLLDRGFRNLVCFARPSSELAGIEAIVQRQPPGHANRGVQGQSLSRADCESACKDVTVIFHLAAGTGEKSFPDAFMNSVVATRNLLEASRAVRASAAICPRQFVHCVHQPAEVTVLGRIVSHEEHPELRGDAYCFAKVKQEQIVAEYGKNFGIPYVVVRPGSVYGAGNSEITGRVGIGTFGLFLHLGGSNTIPFTYVDNCAEAIALAGLVKGVDGEAFNVVDDDLPSSRQFLRLYKKNVQTFQIHLCAPCGELCALLSVGKVFAMVEGTIAARLQSQTLVRRLEKDALQQREIETSLRLGAKSIHGGGIAPIFRKLRAG